MDQSELLACCDQAFAEHILAWYDVHHRSFPWRISPVGTSQRVEPYLVWISELMLQQTGTATVIPYFNRFIDAFPNVHVLAQAPIDMVLAHWQGLGYYRRAHLLHKSAKIIMDQGMPQSYDGWLALPGIGPYTAGAITAIGYNKPAVAIDGNIRRVFSRYFGIKGVDWLNEVAKQARAQLPKNRFGDYTQALMDFGATICKTHQPQCAQCPLASSCYARCVGPIADFPPKIPKGTVKNQSGHFFIAHDADRGLWMRQAGPMDLLPGLWGFPSTPWTSTHADSPADIWSHACTYAGQISHRFTHIALQAHYWLAKDPCALVALFSDQGFTGQWVGWAHLPQYPISTLVRKIIHSVFGSQSKIRTER